jgi:hypothetical protein
MNLEVERYEGELRELREQVRTLCNPNKDYILVTLNNVFVQYNSHRPIKQVLADLPYECKEVYERII